MDDMHESNPMIGLRGCRVGVMYPQIIAMQTRAIFEAACACARAGIVAKPKVQQSTTHSLLNCVLQVMIPLVSHVNELKVLRPVVEKEAKAVLAEQGAVASFDVLLNKRSVDWLQG